MESALGRGQEEHATRFFAFHPTFQVADGIVDFLDDGKDFAKPGFESRFVKIFPDRLVEGVLILDDGAPELL